MPRACGWSRTGLGRPGTKPSGASCLRLRRQRPMRAAHPRHLSRPRRSHSSRPLANRGEITAHRQPATRRAAKAEPAASIEVMADRGRRTGPRAALRSAPERQAHSRRESAPDAGRPQTICLWQTARLVQVEFAVAHAGDERAPLVWGGPDPGRGPWCPGPGSCRRGRPVRRNHRRSRPGHEVALTAEHTAGKAPARKTGRTGTQDCLRSAIQVNGWMVPAGVMCSSRSWLSSSHLAPTWQAICAGL